MLTQMCLRWTEKRGTYRPAGEVIETSRYSVAALDKTRAERFIVDNHYSGTYPAGRRMFGLFQGNALAGVAVFSKGMNDKTLTNCLPGKANESLELGRFVLRDQVPGNGETWFLARCFEQLRGEGFLGVVSFSDPVAREDVVGNRVFGGHVGTIYQAFNGVYLGRGTRRTLRLLPDGRCLNDRAIQKIRGLERNHEGPAELLVRAGATPLDYKDPAGWLPRLTRRMPHPGNHKYVWPLQRSVRKHLAKSLPYPKIGGAA